MNIEDVFETPKDRNKKLWRYMDFSKFVSMLLNRGLYFPRADLLGDPFEGSFPEGNKLLRKITAEHLAEITNLGENTDKFINDFINFQTQFNNNLRKSFYVSCWHINDSESYAMWSLYSKDLKGIAIQTTYELLENNLPDDVNISKVNYINYDKAKIPLNNFYLPILHKRESYSYEEELRAFIFDIDLDAFEEGKWPESQDKGIIKKIELDKLIETIYIAPNSDDWFKDLVKDITKKCGFYDLEIIRSPLEKEPYF